MGNPSKTLPSGTKGEGKDLSFRSSKRTSRYPLIRSECQLPARNCSPRLRCEGVLGRNCKEGVPKHRRMLRIPKESAVRVGADRSAQAGISDVGKSKVVWVCHHSTF